MNKLLKLLVGLLFSVPAFAAGSFWKLPSPFPNSTILVCPLQTANPCPSPSSIFSDVALTVPVTNPFNVGPTGNFGFFVAAGQYTVYVGQPYNIAFDVTLGGGGGGAGTVTNTGGALTANAVVLGAGGNDTKVVTGLTAVGSNELDIGSNTVQGTLRMFGTTGSNTIQAVGNSTETDLSATVLHMGANAVYSVASGNATYSSASTTILQSLGGSWQISSTGSGNLVAATGKGQHINTQAANNDLFGTVSGVTTTATVVFTTNYTSTPVCVVTPTTAGVTSFIITAQANSGFTITYAPSAATNFNYMCGGNPN